MSLPRLITGLLVAAPLALPVLPAAEGMSDSPGGPPVFVSGAGAEGPGHAATVDRLRPGSLDRSVLPGRAAGQRLTFDLFDGVRLTGRVDRVTRLGDTTTWSGSVDGDGAFSIATSGPATYATVRVGNDVYTVSDDAGTAPTITQVDPGGFVERGPDVGVSDTLARELADLERAAPTAREPVGSGAVLDVTVVYTAAAVTEAGSVDALRSQVYAAFDEGNTAAFDSDVFPGFLPSGFEQVTYAESGTVGTDLDRLVDPNDGFMDAAHGYRAAFGSDAVVLVVSNLNKCGRAAGDLDNTTAAQAFTVVELNCAVTNLSLPHELAHLLGAHHDTFVDSSGPAYAHGYVNKAKQWRTIMAYNDECGKVTPCTRIPRFSNPALTWGGDPTGVAGTNEVSRILNEKAQRVTSFRSGVTVPTALSAVHLGGGRQMVFTLGRDRAVYVKEWYFDFADGKWKWKAFRGLGGQLTSPPRAVVSGSGRIDVFALGLDKAVWHLRYNSGTWGDWERLGGSFAAGPAAVSWGNGRIDVFGVNSSGRLVHKWSDDHGASYEPSDSWHQPDGPVLDSGLSAVSTRADTLDVFGTATDGTMRRLTWNGSTWAWSNLSGGLVGTPSAVATSKDRIELFAVGTDSAVYTKRWTRGFGWTTWEWLGGEVRNEVSAAKVSDTRIDVFGVGSGHSVFHRSRVSEVWGEWADLGSYTHGGVAAINTGDNALALFALNDRLNLMRRSLAFNSWTGWGNQGGVAWLPQPPR